jgi:hypothetical protein
MKIVISILPLLLSVSFLYGETIIVPNDYSTIQEAIDIASSGDTILVMTGIYSGPGNNDINFKGKALFLVSNEGASQTVIQCDPGTRGFMLNIQILW